MKNRKLTDQWTGFSFKSGRLITPEGHELLREDLAWISLTAQLAQEYRRLLDDERQRRALPGTIPAYMRTVPGCPAGDDAETHRARVRRHRRGSPPLHAG